MSENLYKYTSLEWLVQLLKKGITYPQVRLSSNKLYGKNINSIENNYACVIMFDKSKLIEASAQLLEVEYTKEWLSQNHNLIDVIIYGELVSNSTKKYDDNKSEKKEDSLQDLKKINISDKVYDIKEVLNSNEQSYFISTGGIKNINGLINHIVLPDIDFDNVEQLQQVINLLNKSKIDYTQGLK